MVKHGLVGQQFFGGSFINARDGNLSVEVNYLRGIFIRVTVE